MFFGTDFAESKFVANNIFPIIINPTKQGKDEFPQTLSRKNFIKQSGIGEEGWDFYINDRQGGKREKLSLGDKAKDHSCFGVKAFRKRKNFWGWG